MHTFSESAEDITTLKAALIAHGAAEKCAKCGIESMWEGSPLNLLLGHINGNQNDNSLDNLHLLCPNCQSQTTAINVGSQVKRTAKRTTARLSLCQACQKPITFGKDYCMVHAATRRWQIDYPEVNTLVKQVLKQGFVKTANTIGVSDQGLRKHMQKELGANHPIFTVRTKNLITIK